MSAPVSDRVARGNLYRLASRLLAREVDAQLLTRLRVAEATVPDVPLLDSTLRERESPGALEELAVEYCRLFIGPEPVCPLYASAHTGGRRLRGRAERDFVTFLAIHELEPLCSADLSLLGVDHLAVHLAVFAHLNDTLAGDPHCETARVALRQLSERHTVPWATELISVLAENARLAPYTTIALVLEQLLALEITAETAIEWTSPKDGDQNERDDQARGEAER